MWRRSESYPGEFVDSKIVTRDFIVAEGFTLSYHFLDKENNPFEKNLRTPIFYLFKVHKNHPMKIFSSSTSYVNIWPANELGKGKKQFRMPAEVVMDRMDHDLSTFMIVPYENPDCGKYWRRFTIKNGFVSETDNQIRDISLLYLKHGTSIHSQDSFHRVSEVMPSQVIQHFFHWLTDSKKITSHEKTFNQKLEGKVEVSLEKAREITSEIMGILEKRYDTRLTFEEYKREIERKNKN